MLKHTTGIPQPKAGKTKKKQSISKARKGVINICPICEEEHYRRKSHADRLMCSKECQNKSQMTGKTYPCIICKKESYRNNGQIKHRGDSKYCSKKCKGKAMSKLAKSQMPKIQKMKTKPNIAKLKKKLWLEFAKYVKARDGDNCFTCGVYCDGANAHAGHFIPKSVGGISLYFHEENVRKQCMRCNIHLGGNQWEYGQRLGEETVARLYKIKNQTAKWTVEDYMQKIQYYQGLNGK